MKTLKFLLVLVSSIIIVSCTDLAFDEEMQQPTADNIQATGGEDANPEDGSKD